jgi:hypothetical protein
MNSNVKKILSFLWSQILFIMWFEAIELSFDFTKKPDIFYFYYGILRLISLIVLPAFVFWGDIVMFMKNIKNLLKNLMR